MYANVYLGDGHKTHKSARQVGAVFLVPLLSLGRLVYPRLLVEFNAHRCSLFFFFFPGLVLVHMQMHT